MRTGNPNGHGAGDDRGDGRDKNGYFTKGNAYAKDSGSPHRKRAQEWRRALVDSVSYEDVCEVIGVLKSGALAGEPWAVKELLERVLGRAGIVLPDGAEQGINVIFQMPDGTIKTMEEWAN